MQTGAGVKVIRATQDGSRIFTCIFWETQPYANSMNIFLWTLCCIFKYLKKNGPADAYCDQQLMAVDVLMPHGLGTFGVLQKLSVSLVFLCPVCFYFYWDFLHECFRDFTNKVPQVKCFRVVLKRLSKLGAHGKTIDGNLSKLCNGSLLPLKQEGGLL